MTKDPSLNAAYALQTPDDSRKLYRDWADTYDTEFVADNGYLLHKFVAEAFAAAGGCGPVLDMGAGTGLCGVVLEKLGLSDIDGTDISREMLDKAADKGVYRNIFEGDILAGLDVAEGAYQGVVSAGTFTLGHVGAEGLDEVVRLLAPGGLAVISVRDSHYVEAGFEAKMALLEPQLAQTQQTETRIYADDTTGDHSEDVAILLHMWKA